MHPLDKQVAAPGKMIPGSVPSIPINLFFKQGTESEMFSEVYFGGLNPYLGAEPRLSDARPYVLEARFCQI